MKNEVKSGTSYFEGCSCPSTLVDFRRWTEERCVGLVNEDLVDGVPGVGGAWVENSGALSLLVMKNVGVQFG